MQILQVRVMRGPNYWSVNQNKLIVVRICVEKFDLITTDHINEYNKILFKYKLSLEPARSTSLCQLTRMAAIALQGLNDTNGDCFGTRIGIGKDESYVIFPYIIEAAGIYAAEAAVKFMNAILLGEAYDIEADIQKVQQIIRRESLGPSTLSITNEAIRRGIPFTRLDNDSLIMLGYGHNQRFVRAAIASSTSSIAVELAQDKEYTKKILHSSRIPVPEGIVAKGLEDLEGAITEIGFPLVIKPLDGNHGRGIKTMIQSREEAISSFMIAQQISEEVIIEKHIQGDDFRFLVINYKLVAVAKRTPANVTGDGVSTIKELIDKVNEDPRRGSGHENVLTRIIVDTGTLAILIENNLSIDSVLPYGKTLNLKDTANLSSGGSAEDVTDKVHPKNVLLAERAARLLNLDICGIDIMAQDIAIPITPQNGAVLEVNASPGLRMHLAPSSGQPRNVAAPIVDMLYPGNASSRIPLVAVTGTNGKTTTTRLIAYLAKQAGFKTGFTTTDGICINNEIIEQGDCSGPQSAAIVLRDPIVDFAVLECARGGILRAGLGFDKCSVSIVTNITEDHLGLDGIETIEELARVKAVVPQSTSDNGYAILNADDDLVYQMKNNLLCNIALFSLSPDNPRIQAHLKEGKIAAFIKDGYFTVCRGEWKHSIAKVEEVPLTFNGTSECMIKNVLPAILTAFVCNFKVEHIREALKDFVPSAKNTPGRMNVFKFTNFKVVLDYAHNEGGYQELKKYARHVSASVKVGVIAATGDRREQDIRNLGSLAAEIFDKLIIRHDEDGRGRSNERLTTLLLEGIRRTKPDMPVKIISNEMEAIRYAIHHAEKDSWIFANLDKIQDVLAFVEEEQQKDKINKPVNSILGMKKAAIAIHRRAG